MLGSFTDARSVRRLDRKMAETGVLEGTRHGADVRPAARQRPDLELRRQQLADGRAACRRSTSSPGTPTPRGMPAAMHAFYLRHCYGENELARGEMELAGTPLHLEEIGAEIYLLAAEEDHIVPWTSAYKATQLFTGAGPLRAELVRPHRRDRQPAEPEGPALDQRRHAGGPAGVAARRATSTPARGGTTGPTGSPSAPARGASRRRMGSDAHPPLGRRAGHLRARVVNANLTAPAR